jgi:hypothetical protein
MTYPLSQSALKTPPRPPAKSTHPLPKPVYPGSSQDRDAKRRRNNEVARQAASIEQKAREKTNPFTNQFNY